MAVKVIPLTCPNCGGSLEIPVGTERCFCTYCGTQIVVDDGTVHLNIHDEADIMRARAEQERAEQHEEQAKRWRIALIVWIVVSVAMLALQGTIDNVAPDFKQTYLVINGGELMFGAIALFLLRPKKVK